MNTGAVGRHSGQPSRDGERRGAPMPLVLVYLRMPPAATRSSAQAGLDFCCLHGTGWILGERCPVFGDVCVITAPNHDSPSWIHSLLGFPEDT